MKNEEIRQMTTEDIIEKIKEEQAQLVKMKLNHAVSPLDNPMKIKESRKIVARLNTELRQRQLNEESK